MAKQRYINIDFPFKDSPEGFYLNLNATDTDAIRSDLLHLLLTNKGERLYLPDFGSDLKKYIFEPNDSITHEQIRDNLNELDKLVKMNVRLKNELNVDSRSYWKNTHKALNKISERLVKLANKVGQLQ